MTLAKVLSEDACKSKHKCHLLMLVLLLTTATTVKHSFPRMSLNDIASVIGDTLLSITNATIVTQYCSKCHLLMSQVSLTNIIHATTYVLEVLIMMLKLGVCKR